MSRTADRKVFLIMAGGTGGHIFPALAVARELQRRQHRVHWLGAVDGMEQKVVTENGIDLSLVRISGLRGKGKLAWLQAPARVLTAVWQAVRVVRQVQPDCVLGMGGFASGPGGLAAWLLRKPLVIHEQNAIAGMTNRLLSKVADHVLCAFPGVFKDKTEYRVTGNPLRHQFVSGDLPDRQNNLSDPSQPLHVLVLGGSLGAAAINQLVPEALSRIPSANVEVRHQCGQKKLAQAEAAYRATGVDCQPEPFINNMPEAYRWADIVICRAGAMTVAELSAVGVASILIPFPYAVDDHQTANAGYLASQHAAILVQESALTADWLADRLNEFIADRQPLAEMAGKAKTLAWPDATKVVADVCEEACNE
ncbi:MAG: undecaprenyldiphospho-muramoylpentapeptide beta-N-acetylglucosaminyltransferase [Proteobacteria bacterium]|nr:MAG: undecaprenyldiphospho-muramoylpentapeptide beta-N-acetylglucosaminyltransferase [Pseudomonadota bacterium]